MNKEKAHHDNEIFVQALKIKRKKKKQQSKYLHKINFTMQSKFD